MALILHRTTPHPGIIVPAAPLTPVLSPLITRGTLRSTFALASTLALTQAVIGCAVPVHKHRHLARQPMQFSDSPATSLFPGILAQTESGAAATGGALAAGCTSCR